MFGVAIAGVPLFEHIVARVLPAYVPALPIVRALVIGSLFWIAVHVVLVGTLQSHGLVRRQFALELVGAALVITACSATLAAHLPLWNVAAASTIAAVVTWGLGVAFVNRVVPVADLPAAVGEWAGRLAAGPTVALSLTKGMLNNAMTVSVDQALEDEARSQHITFSTEDLKEALAAFVDKREPSFTGR